MMLPPRSPPSGYMLKLTLLLLQDTCLNSHYCCCYYKLLVLQDTSCCCYYKLLLVQVSATTTTSCFSYYKLLLLHDGWMDKLLRLQDGQAAAATTFVSMDKKCNLDPILNWETPTFSTPVLAAIIVASVSLFPILLLPSTPSMWVARMTFGYGFRFLLIIAGVALGVSLPYFISSLFHDKMKPWLQRYPKEAFIIRLAGEGNWFNQFRAVAFIRISPFLSRVKTCTQFGCRKVCPRILYFLCNITLLHNNSRRNTLCFIDTSE